MHLSRLDGQWSESWRLRERCVRSQWCEENIRLPQEFSVSSKFSLVGREYFRELLDVIDCHDTEEVVLVGGTQVGKTEYVRAVAVSQGEVDAAPMMLAGPDFGYAHEQRMFTYAICDRSPALRRRVPPERLRNDRWIDLGNCYVYLAWSGSTQRLSGRSCKVVLCSEVDRWTASVHLARQRTKAFYKKCVIYEGTLIGESPQLWGLWEKSDQRLFQVPCPVCGHHQELRFFLHRDGPYAGRGGIGGLKDRDGRWMTPDEGRKQAYYICEQGCRIEQYQKSQMVSRGVWCPRGQIVRPDGTLAGQPINAGRRRGYRINSLYSPATSFGEAAEEWLKVRDSEAGKMSFFNDWLALKYSSRGDAPKWSTIGERLRAGNPLGHVPPQALFLTAGCDVQKEETYWVVRAWGEGGTSWLVDRGKCMVTSDGDGHIDPTSHLQQLVAIFQRDWPVIGTNPAGQSKLQISRGGVDCGYKKRTVHNWLLRVYNSRLVPRGRIVLVAGSHQLESLPYRHSHVEKDTRHGRPYAGGGLRYWAINVAVYKSDIQDRWHMKLTDPGAWFVANADLVELEDYLRQLVNERRTVEVNQKTKHSKEIWVIENEEIGNHYFDCEVYASAIADQVVERNWDNLAIRFAVAGNSGERSKGKRGFIRKPGRNFIQRRDE